MNIDHLSKMRSIFESITSCRQWCGFPNEAKDMTFRAGWPKSSEKFFQVVEKVLFDKGLETTVQDMIKRNKSPAEACEQGNISEMLGRFTTALEAERTETKKEEDEVAEEEAAARADDADLVVAEGDNEDTAAAETPAGFAAMVPASVETPPEITAAVNLFLAESSSGPCLVCLLRYISF